MAGATVLRRWILPLVAMAALSAATLTGHQSVLLWFLASLSLAIAAIRGPYVAWALYFASVCVTGWTLHRGGATVRPETFAFPFLVLATRKRFRDATGIGGAKRDVTVSLILAAALIAVGLYSSLARAIDPVRSLWILTQLAESILAYLLLARSGLDRARLVAIGTWMLGGIATISVLGYLGRLAGAPDALIFGVANDGRLIGFSFESNLFASQCACWVAVLYYWRAHLARSTRFMAAPIVVATVLAGTRAAWLALAFLGIYAAIANWRKRTTLIMKLVAAALTVTGIAWVTSEYQTNSPEQSSITWRVFHLVDTATGTGAYRLNVYALAQQDMRDSDHWMLGSGMNTFSQHHPVNLTRTGAEYLSSIWYELIYDVGILGLTLAILLLATTLAGSARRLDAVPLFVCVMVCASTTNIIWIAFPWVYMGMTSAGCDWRRDRRQSRPSERTVMPLHERTDSRMAPISVK